MTTEQLLIGDHYLFACEVINGLNAFYGIPVKVRQPFDDDHFFNNDIRWGIATISYLFRKDFLKIFDRLNKKLRNGKQFEKYCMLITVSKNDRYFFNFLRRVALIHEIAVCCYRNGRDFFSRAKRCIMWYQDKLYFRSAGSWSSLNKTASFLRKLGNPLLRVILEEITLKYPLTFSETVNKIEQRLIETKDEEALYCKEMDIFRQQQKKYATRELDEKKSTDSQIEKERAFYQCLKSISCMASNDTPDQISNKKERLAIIVYLGSLLSPEISNRFHNKNLSSPERTSSNVTDSFETIDELFQSKPNADDQCIEREGSSIEKGIEATSSDFKGLKSENEEIETNNSKFIEGDLFSSGSAFNDKVSQLYSIDDLINDYTFLTTYIRYSRYESDLLQNNSDSSYDETISLEMPKDEFFPECSSEDKNVQQCRNENDNLDNWKDTQHSSSSSSDTITPFLSTNVDIPKIVSVEQSVVNDDKRDIDTTDATDDKKRSHGQFTFCYGRLIGRVDETTRILHVDIATLHPTATNTIAATNIPTETIMNKSEIDSNTNIASSNSQPQRRRGKKNKRKKKGKRK